MTIGPVRSVQARVTGGMSIISGERLIVGLGSLTFAVGVIWIASHSAAVYLAPDGAHAITDAWALIGRAPRTFYYLPAWPALLLPALLLGIAPVAAVQVGLAVATGLLFAASYALVRTFASARAALVGAASATGSTAVGELLGWQGGTTLIALIAIIVALVAFERWAAARRWSDALSVGLGLALAVAAEPFMALAGAGLLGLRWLVEMRRTPATRRGCGATALPGMALAGVPVFLTSVALLDRYFAISAPVGSVLRLPDFSSTIDLVAWATRETPALLVVFVLVLGAALTTPGSMRVVAGAVAAVFVLLPACLSGDASYQERVAYLLPIPFALGAGMLWDRLDRRAEWPAPPRTRSVDLGSLAAPLVAAVVLVTMAFPTRLSTAAAYYSTLQPPDVRLLASLAGTRGTVATSWQGNHYWYGLVNSWYVEGLSNRPAIGPTDPALSTRAIERTDAADAWQLFSGEQGMENGALQVAFGPAGWRADPAIAARLFGYYIPIVYVSNSANEYGSIAPSPGSPASLRWSVAGDEATGEMLDNAARILRTSATLSGDTVSLSWFRQPGSPQTAWTLWMWPAYGVPWRTVTGSGQSIEISPDGTAAYRDAQAWDALDPRLRVSVSGDARLQYEANEPGPQVQAIRISVPAGSDLHLDVSVSGAAPSAGVQSYQGPSLIAEDRITTVAVWRDTGWVDRFTLSPCFSPGVADDNIATFSVTATCGR